QLSLLGRELTAARNFPDGSPDGGTMYFPETKHTLSGKFLKYWLKRGGLPIFGYPLSEPIEEAGTDGQTRLTQYFERAQFEYHPGALDSFSRREEQARGVQLAALQGVELVDLGRQAAQRGGHNFASLSPLAGAPAWAPTDWPRHIDVDL